ncbi:MAG: hypothetical protein C4K58_06895 [Flavobacteriaceae bacterium]|nr:MAG: hypothetical protein C4K58_06895 [Flavobacteriaceae bacterium]
MVFASFCINFVSWKREYKTTSFWDWTVILRFVISPSEIKDMILKVVRQLKDGETPSYSADTLSKLVSTFDKISDKTKLTVYAMDSFNGFTSYMLEKAAKTNTTERAKLIDLTKTLRPHLDEYIESLLK